MTARSRTITAQDLFAGVDELGRCRVAPAIPSSGSRKVELAYDRRGRSFAVSSLVKGWLVHRLGEPERAEWCAITGPEGRPVVLPVDADAAELFVAVAGAPGRYCLQPADARGRVLAAEASAFVEVVRPVRPFSRDP
ncbi:MAG: hypothetical protein IPI49_02595 [Myxococcales bacterium]|nr:hypothetical protein [Myxococcales bacterium]